MLKLGKYDACLSTERVELVTTGENEIRIKTESERNARR